MRPEYTMSPSGMNVKAHGAAGPAAAASAGKPHPMREGALLGLTSAAGIWLWIAAIDVIAGEPFRVFDVLGGVVVFTVLHVLLNVIYGVAVASVVHRARQAPSVIIGLMFMFIIIEIAFAMATIFLANLGLGSLAWLRIFGGSVVGAVIAFVMLYRRHPLAGQLRRAEAEL
jgi:hypothetical protein